MYWNLMDNEYSVGFGVFGENDVATFYHNCGWPHIVIYKTVTTP